MPPRRRYRHLPTGGALWQRRRAWAALGATCLLLGGAGGALSMLGLEARLWRGEGTLSGVYMAAPDAAPTSAPQPLPSVPEPAPPALRLPLAPPQPLKPEPPAEPAPVAAAELLPVQSHLLLELPAQDFTAAPARPATARRALPAEPPSAPAAAAEGDFTPPAYLHAPRPPYPAAMRQSRVEGSVRLRIHVDAEGAPQRVDIIAASGHAELDSTAREWVLRHWRFTPAHRGGAPVPASVVTSVQFVLSD